MRLIHAAMVTGVVLLVLLTSACNPDALMHRIATPERDARAQHVIHMIVAGEHDSLLAESRFDMDSAARARVLFQLDSALRGRQVDSMTLVGANLFSMSGTDRLTLSYEFHTEKRWIFSSVTTLDSASTWKVIGFHVEPLAGELRAMNDFRLADRSAVQYLALLAVVLCTVFTLGTAIFLATRRNFPKRWRWVLASLVGVASASVNWTTGEVATRMIFVQLFAASAVRASEFAPWILSFSFPLGAIVALARYRSYLASSRTPVTPESLEQPPSPQAAT
jgi:hypothetical protein